MTVPGVRFVVDTGMVKARMYNAREGADTLQIVPISKAQARQRTGRAGKNLVYQGCLIQALVEIFIYDTCRNRLFMLLVLP